VLSEKTFSLYSLLALWQHLTTPQHFFPGTTLGDVPAHSKVASLSKYQLISFSTCSYQKYKILSENMQTLDA